MSDKHLEIELNKVNQNDIVEKKTKKSVDQTKEIDISENLIKIDVVKKENTDIKNLDQPIYGNNKCNFANDDGNCQKKLGLLDLQLKCKCENVFCIKHRHFKNHNCTFDYKKNQIKLDKIIAEKIKKI